MFCFNPRHSTFLISNASGFSWRVLGGLLFPGAGDAGVQGLCSLGVLLLLGFIQHQLSRTEGFVLPGKMAPALTQRVGGEFGGEEPPGKYGFLKED